MALSRNFEFSYFETIETIGLLIMTIFCFYFLLFFYYENIFLFF